MCSLITSEELKQAHLTEDGLTNLCKKNIFNAFENVPFGDLKYGLLGSVSAEMLHISGLAGNVGICVCRLHPSNDRHFCLSPTC
jgi:hypothetical protein